MRFPPERGQLLLAPKPQWLGADTYGIRDFWQEAGCKIRQFGRSIIRQTGELHQF
jgi:hypothetical protein